MPNWVYGTITPTSDNGMLKLVKLLNGQEEDKYDLCAAIMPLPKGFEKTSSPLTMMEIVVSDGDLIAKLEEKAPGHYGSFEVEGKEYKRTSKKTSKEGEKYTSEWNGFVETKLPTSEEAIELNKVEQDLYDTRVAENPKGHFYKRTYTSQEESDKLEEEHGTNNWYDWKCKNYGTKWGDCNGSLEDYGYTLETAWSPLHGRILEKLHDTIGDFHYEWEEEQGFGGEFLVNENGMETIDEYDVPEWMEITEEEMEGLSDEDKELLGDVVKLAEDYEKQGDTYYNGYYNYWDLSSFMAATLEETLVVLRKE